jgi:hypothetical protein
VTTAALWLSGVSIGVALSSLAWSVISGIRSGRAVSREEVRREEEIALLRSQVEHQARGEQDDKAAVLVGRSVSHFGTERGVTHSISVRNVGRYAARDVKVWLTPEREGADPLAATPLTDAYDLGALATGDDPALIPLLQEAPFSGGKVERAGRIVASWTDGNDNHVDEIGKLTVFL